MSEALVERLNAAEIALRDDRPYAAVAIGEAADRIEALERENAECRRRNEEMDREITGLRNSYWEERKAHLAAEADKARLSEALRNVRADCQSTIDLHHRVGPSFTSPGGDEYEPASYVMDKMQELVTRVDAALSGSGSGWPVPDGWKLVPVELTSKMCTAGYDAVEHVIGMVEVAISYRAMIAASPAAPQQGGE